LKDVSAEVVDPVEEGFAARAAGIFSRDGFVLVKNVLDEERRPSLSGSWAANSRGPNL
jgi:hypothetical protein